jgi:hypothetical protein
VQDLIGRPDTEISFVRVETDAEAADAGFAGSPTFIVDGIDLFGPASAARRADVERSAGGSLHHVT